MKYHYLVFIGRFQPYHKGHHHVVLEALKQCESLIICIGSHNRPRDSRNPLTTDERISIIKSALTPDQLERVHFVPVEDHAYNEPKWLASIQAGVNTVVHRVWRSGPVKIGIVGYDKDHSSYYLKSFPQWENVYVDPVNKALCATEFRNLFFGYDENTDTERIWDYYIDKSHMNETFRLCISIQRQIRDELLFLQKYKEGWKNAPYPPTFNTVDAVVVQSGHILLVERGAMPGRGLYALPGGFVNQHETLREAIIRELYEETRIAVPKPVLAGSIVKSATYDYPYRSLRGRTITEAYYIRLADQDKLPKIKGSDDAKKAFWVPLSEFWGMRDKMFEDHFDIVMHIMGM